MFLFLMVVQAIVAASLVGVILIQRSEGGGLGVGGSPSGMMSARGAADFLTRTTAVLAVLFVSLSIALAVLAAAKGSPSTIDDTLNRAPAAAPVAPAAPADAVPLGDASADPLSAAASQATGAAPVPSAEQPVDGVPLDQ